jgi:hypothetical protein
VLLLVVGVLAVRLRVQRERAFRSDEPTPPAPRALFSLGAVLILSILVSCGKLWVHLHPRATVVVAETPLRTGPDPQTSTLTTLSEGAEVEPLSVETSWVRVRLPDSGEGWLPLESLFHTSGRALW